MIGFVIWCIAPLFFWILGAVTYKKTDAPAAFWANISQFPVKDVRAYNRAVAKLWYVFGTVLFLLGLPLLPGQNAGFIVITILGTMFLAIGTMVFYILVIDQKYRKDGTDRESGL